MEENFETALRHVSDTGIRAIEGRRADELKAVLESLKKPLSVAVSTLGAYGIRFDSETAGDVFPTDWRILELPIREYQRLLEAASLSEDGEIIEDAAFWPFEVMQSALESGDHYTFRRVISYFPYMAVLAEKTRSIQGRRILADRSWRHPREFGWLLTDSLIRADHVRRIDDLTAYCKELLHTLVEIMRGAIQRSDAALFEDSQNGFWQVIDIDYVSNQTGANIELPEEYLEVVDEKRARMREALVEIRDYRDALWFSLGAWLTEHWLDPAVDKESAQRAYSTMAAPFASDFPRLWLAFNTTLVERRDSRFPLRSWAMAGTPEGVVATINPERSVARLFALLSLTVASPVPYGELPAPSKQAQARWFSDLVDGELSSVLENLDQWVDLVGEIDQSLVAVLRELLDAAVEDEEKREWRRIVEQPLSDIRKQEFSRDFLSAWAQSGLLRRLFQELNAITYTDERSHVPGVIGHLLLVPKGYFVDETGSTIYRGLGGQVGSSIARAEDDRILYHLRANIRPRRLAGKPLGRALSDALEWIRARGHLPGFILSTKGWELVRRLEGNTDWVPDYSSGGFTTPTGVFEDVPVYTLHRGESNELIVVSVPGVGSILQYIGENGSLFYRYAVKGFTPQSAREAGADRSRLPANLRDLPEDDLVKELIGQAEIRIEEAFIMTRKNPGSVVRISLEE